MVSVLSALLIQVPRLNQAHVRKTNLTRSVAKLLLKLSLSISQKLLEKTVARDNIKSFLSTVKCVLFISIFRCLQGYSGAYLGVCRMCVNILM